MPVRETAAIRIISTTAGVVTFWTLRKMLSLPASRVICNDEDACTVYINLMAPGQPFAMVIMRISEALSEAWRAVSPPWNPLTLARIL